MVVRLRCAGSVMIVYHVRVHVLLQVGHAEAAIPIICDVTAVHDLSKQVTKIFPRDLK